MPLPEDVVADDPRYASEHPSHHNQIHAAINDLEALAGTLSDVETTTGSQGKVDTHALDTTSVHGISDTAQLPARNAANTFSVAQTINGGSTATDRLNLGSDVTIYRSSSNIVKTDDNVSGGGFVEANAGAGSQVRIGDIGGVIPGILFGSSFATSLYVAGDTVLVTNKPFKTGQSVTGSRPSPGTMGAGAQWYDTTLGIPIWSNGSIWTDAAGLAV